MNRQQHYDFWKYFADNHVDIQNGVDGKKGFIELSYDGLVAQMQKCGPGFVLGIDTPENEIVDNNSNNFLCNVHGAFVVLHECKPGDFDAIRTIQAQCWDIANNISKKAKDRSRQMPQTGPLYTWDYNKLSFSYVDSLFYPGFCGCRVDYEMLTSNEALRPHPEKWL